MRCLLWIFATITVVLSAPNIIVNAAGKYAYTDALARNFFMPACAATEAENPASCLSYTYTQLEMKRHVTVTCDETRGIDTCSALTAVSHGQKTIVIAFRGTVGETQLVVESLTTLLKDRTPWIAGGKVSSYFYSAFFKLWDAGIKDDFTELAQANPTYDLYITGHSLGGALASLGASYIGFTKLFPVEQIKMISMGQPRTGDSAYADAFDNLILYAYRVIHSHDIVPTIPPKGLEGFRHHKSEIWYNNKMVDANYKECDAQESLLCSGGQIDLSTNDHHYYFNAFITFWGQADCYNATTYSPYYQP